MEQFVPDVLVENLGDDIGAQPLDLVWAGMPLAQQRGLGGLNAEDPDVGPFLGQDLAHTGQGAAGADTGDEGVELTGLLQEFARSRLPVDPGVGRVGELGCQDRVGGRLLDLLGPLDRTGDAALRGEHELGAESAHDRTALLGHSLRHRDDDLVAQSRADHGQADARVAAGGLDDRAARLEIARLLGCAHDRQGDAVLDGPGGLEGLDLGQDRDGAGDDAIDAHQRGAADGLGDVGQIGHDASSS